MHEDPSSPASQRPRDFNSVENTGPPAPLPAQEFVRRVVQDVGRATDPASASMAFISHLERLIPGARGWVAAWQHGGERAVWIPAEHPGPVPLGLGRTPGGLLFSALSQSHPSIVHDVGALAEVAEKLHLEKGGGAWAFLPVTAAGRTVACLLVNAPDAASLSGETVGHLRQGLPVLGLAIRSGLLQRELQDDVEEKTRELAALFDVSRELGSVRTPEDFLLLLSRALHETLELDVCALTLLPPRRSEVCVLAGRNVPEEVVTSITRSAVVEIEQQTGRPWKDLAVRVNRHDDDQMKKSSGGRLRSTAHAPVYLRQEIVGLLTIGSCGASFGAMEQRLLSAIALQASLTVHRLQATEDAESTRIRSMVSSMADGVLLINPELRVLMTNPLAIEYLEVLTGNGRPSRLERLGETELATLFDELSGPDAAARKFEVKAGESRTYLIKCSPVRSGASKIEGLVVVIADITESRRLQMQLTQNERLSAIGQMLSGVAHELNNPIASVIANAQMLQTSPLEDATRNKLDTISSQASRCSRIVKNLLRFSRKHTPEREPLDLNQAVDSVLQLLGGQMQSEGIDFEAQLDSGLRPVVGDFHLLQQVVFNIVNNACQALRTSTGPARLTIRTWNADERVFAEITDNGPGIPEKNLKRIFDPFFTTKDVDEGTGLGLSLAYETVSQHGGKLSVESTSGEGTTFVVNLPSAAEGVLIPVRPEQDGAAAILPDPPCDADGQGARILIVDDEINLVDVAAEFLASYGHEVDTACDGETARTMIAANTYDLIITDLKMPIMGGRELYENVLSTDPELAGKIVFSTGDSANPDTLAFFEATGNCFLTKPFNLADLLKTVELVLDRS